MIPHERANSFLRIVYRDGLDRAKSVLSEQAKTGDRIARTLLNAVGLHEQGKGGKVQLEAVVMAESGQTYRPAELAGHIRFVLETREKALLVDRLVSELIESCLPVGTAIETLM